MATGTITVNEKSFKFTDEESELEAYAKARRYLRELHDKAVARVHGKSAPDKETR